MPLEKQPFKLPFAQGMNQKADPKTLTGGLTLVENAVYRKEGEVVKRAGWTSLPQALASGGSLSQAEAAAVYEGELLLWSQNRIYTYSDAQEKWYDRGAAYSAAVETKQIIASNTNYDFADSVYAAGVVLVAYEISSTVRYQMYDYSSGAILKGDTEIAPAAVSIRPKCVTISDLLYVVYSNTSNQIKGVIINPTTGAITSTVTIATDSSLSACFDAIAVASDTIMVVYKTNFGEISIKYLNSSLGARGAPYSNSTSASNISTILRLIPLTSGRVLSVNMGTETNLQARLISATGSVGSDIDTGIPKTVLAVNATQISGHQNGSDATVYAQYTAASEANNFVYSANVSTSGAANTSALFMRSVGLSTRGWVHGSTGFIGLSHKSGLQATYFIADQNGVIVSRHQPGTGGGGTFNNCVAGVWSAETGRYEFAILNKTRIIATTDTLQLYNFSGNTAPSGSNIYSPLNVAITSLDFQDSSNFSTAELGGSLMIVGGVLNMYDGLSVVEHGFFVYPEGMTITTAVGGSVASGTYLVCAVYEWTDAKGMTHRSAPSVPVSITPIGPVKILVSVPTLRITQKKSSTRANVTIAVYRTQSGQSGPFYRVSSITAPTQNDVTVDSVVVEDGLADSSLPGRDYLYTAGGILDNTAASAAKYIKVWRNRVMLGGLEDGSLQYSKPCAKGSPVEFAAENTLELESDGGSMTGFEILDEKLIVFKNDWAYLTYGDGPDALGVNGMFSPLERIASCDVGCIDQQSTCAIPGAVLFKSTKGYQLLGRDLSASYIGADVEDYNPLSVTSATLFATQSEIRITNSDGIALVYNYEFSRWSAFDNHEAVDGMRWQNQFVHVKSDGKVCIETEGTFRDDGVNYEVTLITGWQAFGDLAGFQRIYRAQLVGEYKSPCSLTLRAAYDYNDEWIDAGSLDTASNHRWQFIMKRQKCEAMRFEITASVSEGILSGEGVALSSMTLLFGIKRPLAKLRSAQKTGLSTI